MSAETPSRREAKVTAKHAGSRLHTVLSLLAAGGLLLGLIGCSARPPTVPISLEPAPEARVWPPPPDAPRYALAKILIGERDFIAPGEEKVDSVGSALNWLAGIIVGEPTYLELQRPVSGLTDERGWIYVVDASHRAIVVFDMAEQRLRLWQSAAKGEAFESPIGIARDAAGAFLVTDSERGEVFRLSAEGEPIGRFGKGIVNRPTGIAVDPVNDLVYVADSARHDIKVFDGEGLLLDVLGGRGRREGLFNAPTNVAVHEDELYVADTLNFRVQVFDRNHDEELAFGRLGLFVGNMTRPKGVAIGGDGRIYVVESYYDHLLVFDKEGHFLLPIGGTGHGIGEFYLPAGVWTDDRGYVYVADMFNGRVVVFKELTPVEGG